MSIELVLNTSGLDKVHSLLAGFKDVDKIEVLEAIGSTGASQTQRRIAEEKTDPDGRDWQPLNPAYEASKQGSGGILEKDGHLVSSIAHNISGKDQVSWGSNLAYAAIHQLGGTIKAKKAKALVFSLGNVAIFAKEVDMPARPFLGVSEDNKKEIEQVCLDVVARPR